MERVIFDRMADFDQEHWWYVARRKILAEVIGRIVAPPAQSRVLEIGCGTGHNLAMLQQFGQVDACELDSEARRLASIRLGRPVHEARLPDLSAFEPGSYDVIALLDVLEHVEDDAAALSTIRQLLKPGGSLILTVPANKWMWSGHDVAHHHHRRYARADLQRLASRCGFESRLMSHFNSLLFPLIAGVRLFNKLAHRHEADDAMPSPVVNQMLEKIFAFEANLIGRVDLPVGVSLLAVLRAAPGKDEAPLAPASR